MARYRFTDAERYAVFTAHNERCWICGEPLSLADFDVDHIIPESLDPEKLAEVIDLFGLKSDFDLNSFSNWMPSHRKCNKAKGDLLFKPSPLIQQNLQRAEERSIKAAELRDTFLSDRKIARAISVLIAAGKSDAFSPKHAKFLDELQDIVFEHHNANREQHDKGKPLLLAPWLEIVGKKNGWLYLRGPGGMVGGRPDAKNLDSSWDCPRCGVTGWNGARCISCGMLDDGD